MSQTQTELLVTYNSVATLVLSSAYLIGIFHDYRQFNSIIFGPYEKCTILDLMKNVQDCFCFAL